MAIADNLAEVATRIRAEISAANATTGMSDTNLDSAIQSLIDGYGGGSSLDSVTFNISYSGIMPPGELHYIDDHGAKKMAQLVMSGSASITVLKDSIIAAWKNNTAPNPPRIPLTFLPNSDSYLYGAFQGVRVISLQDSGTTITIS